MGASPYAIDDPSVILRRALAHDPPNWTRGTVWEDLPVDGEMVTCHCQGGILLKEIKRLGLQTNDPLDWVTEVLHVWPSLDRVEAVADSQAGPMRFRRRREGDLVPHTLLSAAIAINDMRGVDPEDLIVDDAITEYGYISEAVYRALQPLGRIRLDRVASFYELFNL